MLRQALVEAEAGQRKERLLQQQLQQELSSHIGEVTALNTSFATQSGAPVISYASTHSSVSEGLDVRSNSTEEDGDSLSQLDDDEKSAEDEDEVITLPEKAWNGIKALVRVVANVENLWDSPPQPIPLSSSGYYPQSAQSRQHRRRNQYVVLFWFVVLASSYAGERSTYKLLVDRAGPFRLFSVQMITITHTLLMGCGLLVSYYVRLHQRPVDGPIFMPLGIPLVDCVLMALLDTVAMVIVFLTGAHVPPTLTVILVQFTIPLTAFLTQFIHPDGRFKCCRFHDQNDSQNQHPDEHSPLVVENDRDFAKDSRDVHSLRTHHDNCTVPPVPTNNGDERLPGWGGLAAAHVWGSLILFVAVSLALFPAFYSIANPDFFIYADAIPTRTAINTIFFVLSCFPAAASQLYKEHIFLQYRQPVNMGYLNFILSIFQFIFVSVASPVAYGLQGLGSRGAWTKLYPASGFSDNFMDGLKCFFGVLDDEDQEYKYPEDAECRLTLLLVLLYVFSIIAVGVAVDKIVNAGATKVMYRGISAGIIVAVLSMHYYDMHITDFSYGPAIDALNLVCLVLLVLGSEVYHRASLQESTFETIYPEVLMPAFDD
jgi:CRT-like, chloroquine-resistance transporter-like